MRFAVQSAQTAARIRNEFRGKAENMSIIFQKEKNIFTIDTLNTRYMFEIVYGKFPVHLYYGSKDGEQPERFRNKVISFAPFYKEHGLSYLPDYCMAEYTGFDSGDYRASALKIRNGNGDDTTVLKYQGYRIFQGRAELAGLPFAEADEQTETLEICLADEVTGVQASLYYTVFAEEDIISRYVKLTNAGKSAVSIEKCMSLQLDLPGHDYEMISLYGGHNNERNYQRVPLHFGSQSIFSRRGASSNQFNPFMALCAKGSTQTSGNVYGFNFVYSGSFLDEVEVDQNGSARVLLGLGSENFRWQLGEGESFVSPEAVMTFSSEGVGQMSRNFHNFVRKHILPPEPFAKRPVVLNTWEACFFDIDENEMERFAKAAADCGIDMLVMDDGWFGARNHDRAGLGDWFVNKTKFPKGLKAFVQKMKSYGIKFGIWIEPEMINPDSELFRAHPEWCIQCRNREMMESRNQMVLDLGNPDVLQYLKDIFSETFADVPLDYFKWDANRHLSQVGSMVLPPQKQGEAAYRHMLGVYEFFRWFREKYPQAMIENCSGGGGRYDLGMMKYSTMIWTSDNTVPQDRVKIQYSSVLGYPAATMSCHVSNHKHICEVPKELQYRFHVALGGALGYEMHLPNASDTVKNTVREQVESYRKYEDLILQGDYYSLINPFETNYSAYYYTDAARERILLSFLQHTAEAPKEVVLPVTEAIAEAVYVDEISGCEYTGRELQQGVCIMSEDSVCNSCMWYLVKKA